MYETFDQRIIYTLLDLLLKINNDSPSSLVHGTAERSAADAVVLRVSMIAIRRLDKTLHGISGSSVSH